MLVKIARTITDAVRCIAAPETQPNSRLDRKGKTIKRRAAKKGGWPTSDLPNKVGCPMSVFSDMGEYESQPSVLRAFPGLKNGTAVGAVG